jgi:hypothetical protein
LTKVEPFGEGASSGKAANKDAVNGHNNWEGNMGWLIPIAMLASAVIVAVALTRL